MSAVVEKPYKILEIHAISSLEAMKVKQFISSRRDQWVPKYIRGSVERQEVIGWGVMATKTTEAR